MWGTPRYYYIVVLSVIGLCGLLYAGFLYVRGLSSHEASIVSSVVQGREVPEGFREYRSGKYRFSVLYPEDLVVVEEESSATSHTLVFQNQETGFGFQVYLLAYEGSTISEDRFLQDVPLGVRENPTKRMMDGVEVVAFSSRDTDLGETSEVWAIYGGYLYEITTIRLLEPWLNEILKTWKFL